MISSDGTFTGYACRFGEIAVGYNEVVDQGAFADTIAAWQDDDTYLKLLWNHDSAYPIGVIEEMREDSIGLWVRGKLAIGTEAADDVKKLIEAGALDGMSISFNTISSVMIDGVLHNTEVDLIEISIVTFPAIEEAQIDALPRVLSHDSVKGTTQMELFDRMTLDEASVTRTADGYLTAYARVARTGIQEYKGSEVGRPDLEVVKVYRPEAEVFSDKALKSFAHRPITLNHPPQRVTAGNWKKYSAGQTGGEVVRDGEFVRVPLVLMDGDVIKRVEDGERELSMGYSTELKWEKGQTKDGLTYDAIQTDIRGNHLAVVAAARGGSHLRIGDTIPQPKDTYVMADRTITVDGVAVTTNDVSASVIERAFSRAEERVKDLTEKLKEAKAEAEKAKSTKDAADADSLKLIQAKDGEIAVLKKEVADGKMTPDKLSTLVKDRQLVCDKAITILGDKYVVDNKEVGDIRRDVVAAKIGDAAAKGMTDAGIEGAFAAITADTKTTTNQQDGVNRTARAFSPNNTIHSSQDARDAAWEKQGQTLKDAWKTPGQVATKQ